VMRSDMMTRQQAAEYIGASVSWLARRSDGGPPWLRIAGKVYYLMGELDKWIESQKGAPCSTDKRQAVSGGAASGARVKRSAHPLAKQIGERLRQKSDASEVSAKRKRLEVLDGEG